MRILFFILSNLFAIFSFAQKEDNTWILGGDNFPFRIEFNDFEISLTPEPEREVQMHSTNTSLSDENGNLIFYTNGIHIYNYLNEIVENGDSINCCDFFFDSFYDFGYPSIQGAFFVKSQLENNIYFLIHSKVIPEFGGSVSSILYSIIDINASNGLGKVLEKNILLFDETPLEKMHLTQHANGRDWWIVIPDKLENKFYRFLFSQDSFQGPFEQSFGEEPNTWGAAHNSFSTDGQKYVYFPEHDEISILDFDRCTGEFSNEIRFRPFPLTQLPDIHLFYGVAFSPNSQFLYLQYGETSTAPTIPFTPYDGILQYNMAAADIESSKFEIIRSEIGLSTSFGSGLDGKIYYTSQVNGIFGAKYISVISQPNQKGVNADVRTYLMNLPAISDISLFPHFPNYRLGPIDGSPCDTLGIDNLPLAGFRCEPDSNNNLQIIFTDNSFYEPTEWSWSFGDGAMSSRYQSGAYLRGVGYL